MEDGNHIPYIQERKQTIAFQLSASQLNFRPKQDAGAHRDA